MLKRLYKLFHSIPFAITLISIIALFCLIGTVIEQNQPSTFYLEKYSPGWGKLILFLGFNHLYYNWWFLFLLGVFCVCLFCCIISRLRLPMPFALWGSFFSHLGILLIAFGGLITGIWGERGYLQLSEGESKAYYQPLLTEKPKRLPFKVKLEDFFLEYYPGAGKLALYTDKGQLLEHIPVKSGLKHKVKKKNFTLEILKVVPDFELDINSKKVRSRSANFRNPALQLKLSNNKHQEKQWIFARFPEYHNKKTFAGVYFKYEKPPIKDYFSHLKIIQAGQVVKEQIIEVNKPLKFSGYTFYQSSYDQENEQWSGLQVSRDPGIMAIYTGFIILIIGLFFTFFYTYPGKKNLVNSKV